ncbi:hypothetical protein DIPPA_00699 [Diplonema papillatum]|nr:hypothetical protein DIPPA_00699 [Diplonema papillatum]
MLLELKGTDKNLEEAVPKTNDTASISSGHTVDGSVQHKLRLQDQIIQMLYAKLKAEQTHRLETEEQAASMVAAEEDTIRKLEDKLREAEERDTNNSMARMTPRSSATPSSAIVHASTPVLNTHRTRLASPSPPQKAYTLESQLAEVTRDFNQSLEMWTRKLNTPPASARRASHLGDPATHGTAREAAPVGLPTSMAAEADQHQSFSSADASLLPADDGDFFPDTPAVKRQARFEASPYHDDFLPDSPTPSSRLPLSEL